jgi:uncharacterized membrane protein YdfJ with MMPL/SSD domain
MMIMMIQVFGKAREEIKAGDMAMMTMMITDPNVLIRGEDLAV